MSKGTPPSAVALIPARHGSKRVPGKNIRPLQGHPLIAYTIAAARASRLFESIIVSTDSEETAAVASHYGAEAPFLRPAEYATDTSPDIEWLYDLLQRLAAVGRTWDVFALLRPTSPFRSSATIRRAWAAFTSEVGVDSLRAVERCSQHPGKMWVIRGTRMFPLLPFEGSASGNQPWHSTPYQALPPVYVQNASLEMARTPLVTERRTLAGEVIVPFVTDGYEGFDINEAMDWLIAERLIAEGAATLPDVPEAPYTPVSSYQTAGTD